MEFSAGSVISRAFTVWLRNLLPFTLLTLIVYSPLILWAVALSTGQLTLRSLQLYASASVIVTWALSLVATGAITYGVFQQLSGRHAPLLKCLTVGLSRLLAILGVGILTGLCVVMGAMALLIPGIVFFCMLWVAVPVAVVERPGVFDALKRSMDLTSGHKWRIFAIVVMLAAIGWLVQTGVRRAVLGSEPTLESLRVYLVANVLVSGVLGALGAVANAVGYHDLRVARDGVGVQELLKVFE